MTLFSHAIAHLTGLDWTQDQPGEADGKAQWDLLRGCDWTSAKRTPPPGRCFWSCYLADTHEQPSSTFVKRNHIEAEARKVDIRNSSLPWSISKPHIKYHNWLFKLCVSIFIWLHVCILLSPVSNGEQLLSYSFVCATCLIHQLLSALTTQDTRSWFSFIPEVIPSKRCLAYMCLSDSILQNRQKGWKAKPFLNTFD